MKTTIGMLKPSHIDRDNIQKRNFIPPTVITQGTPNVSKLHFPVTGFKAIFEQMTGPITNAGTLQGLLEESDDDSTYTTVNDVNGNAVALAVAAAALNVQQVKVLITKPYVRYTGTVSVSTGTVVTTAGLVA